MKRSGFNKLTFEAVLEKTQAKNAARRMLYAEEQLTELPSSQKVANKPKSAAALAGKKRSKEKRAIKDGKEHEFKRVCRERDGNRCRWIEENGQRCSYTDVHIHVHHISPRSQRPDERYNAGNGACVCGLHHDAMHHTVNGRQRGRELGLLGGITYEKSIKDSK